MSKRILKLNRTNDNDISNWGREGGLAGGSNAEQSATLSFHPLAADRLSKNIEEKRDALAAATQDAVPAVLDTIERLRKNPDGIDPSVASRIGDMLHHALTAMKTSVDLDAAADRDGYNGLKVELEDLQARLLDALDQIQSKAG